MKIKQLIIRVFFGVEVVVVIGCYLFSSHGLSALRRAKRENDALQVQVGAIKAEVAELEFNIAQWNSDSFYAEKIAREQLQMARPGEEVYYLS